MYRLLIGFLLVIAAFRCKPTDPTNADLGKGLAGTWLLSETGFSPGFGYTINKVPSTPRQTLTLTTDGQVMTQGIKAYQSFTHYRLDTLNKLVRIHFTPSNPDYSEIFYINGDTLRLYQTQCIEGCHNGFLRTTDKV